MPKQQMCFNPFLMRATFKNILSEGKVGLHHFYQYKLNELWYFRSTVLNITKEMAFRPRLTSVIP